MDINSCLNRRKIGLGNKVEIDFLVDRIKIKESLKLRSEDNPTTHGPLATTKINNNVIAVASEDGQVNLVETKVLRDSASWVAHENAIFDIKTTPDNKFLLTASGDTTIKIWDLNTKKQISMISAHHSSVKSISLYDPNTLVSGSRDGSIQVHDLRLNNPSILIIRDAHRNHIISKRRRVSTKTDPTSCVTNVAFDQNFPRIYSTGANDATIKLWDLRRHTQTNKPRRTIDGKMIINQPSVEVHHPTKGLFCGYSHLLISSNKVFAACSDNKIYSYDNFSPNAKPKKFTGYRYETYLKLAVIDDRFLFSGAKGGGAIIWTLGNKDLSIPIGQLEVDDDDTCDTNVIETDWDSLSIFTFRDDRLVCKWGFQQISKSENY